MDMGHIGNLVAKIDILYGGEGLYWFKKWEIMDKYGKAGMERKNIARGIF